MRVGGGGQVVEDFQGHSPKATMAFKPAKVRRVVELGLEFRLDVLMFFELVPSVIESGVK